MTTSRNFIVLVLFVSSCVQVPQESVELSRIMGRDIKSVYTAHSNLVNLHFNSIEHQINAFVDDVYAPFQISRLVQADVEDMQKGLDDTLAGALRDAPSNNDAAKRAMANMDIFLRLVREEVESYRSDLLHPVQEQRRQLLKELDQAYGNIISANASITAHLSSIRKLKDTQQELLQKMGFEKEMLDNAGARIAQFSGQVDRILDVANKVDAHGDKAIQQFNQVKDQINNLIK